MTLTRKGEATQGGSETGENNQGQHCQGDTGENNEVGKKAGKQK